MEKDFWRWNKQKSKLNNAVPAPLFKEREIWFCHLGLNVGHEQDRDLETFLRPVIILKKFSNTVFFAIPLTRTPRFGREYFTVINDRGVGFAMLSQGRVLDTRRLNYYSTVMLENEFESLKLRFLLNIV
ncbi:MAG TPA: hypothetical protein VIJ29_03765 [Candidatus Paceibacterota bacterium]